MPVQMTVAEVVLVDVKRRDGVQSRATWWESELWRNAGRRGIPAQGNAVWVLAQVVVRPLLTTLCRQHDSPALLHSTASGKHRPPTKSDRRRLGFGSPSRHTVRKKKIEQKEKVRKTGQAPG